MSAMLMLVCALLPVGQARPDFSGTWMIDESAGSASGGGNGEGRGPGNSRGGGLGLSLSPDRLVIKQDAAGMSVEQRRSPVRKVEYRFDGSEKKNSMPAGPRNTRRATFRSSWEGDRLVTVIATEAPDRRGLIKYREVRYLQADGSMVVELSVDGRPQWRRTIYRRAQ